MLMLDNHIQWFWKVLLKGYIGYWIQTFVRKYDMYVNSCSSVQTPLVQS